MKNSTYIIFLSLLVLPLLFAGCSLTGESDNDEDNTDYIMSGYYWMAGDEATVSGDGASRASINIWEMTGGDNTSTSYPFQTLVAKGTNGSFVNNYPERGQRTYYTVTPKATVSSYTDSAGANQSGSAYTVYKIAARTEFPRREDIFDHYQEEYYILDLDGTNVNNPTGDGNWTGVDPIVEQEGSTWKVNAKAREKMELHYRDGSVRYEWIVADGYDEKYAHFDINGSMRVPGTFSPPLDSSMQWSSKVYYYQKMNTWVGFWYREEKEVFGVRYYTESDEGSGKTKRTSLSYERVIYTSVDTSTSAEDFFDSLFDIILGTHNAQGATTESLAETVIRDEISKTNRKITRSNTVIVPTFGDSFSIDGYSEYDI